ncbi:hypothetical protein HD553DRAFT_367411 [Filobasidium floriforme]|uniref:uncharacterized protein n=1 Tax=Filobasidium floriforme TaxID=5210 RepID=UPI001E8D1143|nr:uncharacterized protein HD553DRAFT_367411 [Filobasidium floriforme]KAH8088075.1 hypothetical protein HD553DRAFT_367411 [Filobasidium floriforme]
MFTPTLLISTLTLLGSTWAAPKSHADHDHVSYSQGGLGKRWYQDSDSETAKLFRRAPANAGTPEWQAQYPAPGTTPPTSSLPQAWLDRLAAVTASPDFPKFGPTQPNNGYPTYANGLKGTDPEVCSFTYECISEEDLTDAPQGVVGLNFDDGPTPFSPDLYDYIEKNNISATHFMIGGNIYYNWQTFQRAVNDGGHIASHTWSHPYMTTLTNEQVVAELGWTSQIIADLNDGRVPAYWRPPFGDTDNRVRMIAQQVFGLKTVPWQIGRDSADWSISDTAPSQNTRESVISTMTGWLTDPAKKGYIDVNEASKADLDVFFAVYPVMIQNNWTVKNVADANDLWEYVNAEDNESPLAGPTGIVQSGSPGNLSTYEPMASGTASGTASQSTGASSTGSSNSTTMSSSAALSSSAASSMAASGSSNSAASATRSASQSPTTSTATQNNATNGGSTVSPTMATGLISVVALAFGLLY